MEPILYTCYLKKNEDFEDISSEPTPKLTETNNSKMANKILSEVKAQNEITQNKINKLTDALAKVEKNSEWTFSGLINYISNINIYTFLLVIVIFLILILF